MNEIEYKDVMKRFDEFDERLERISAVLLKENEALLGALEDIMECPVSVDQATVPKAGIEAAPGQVVLEMSMGLLKHRKARDALALVKGEEKEEQVY